MFIARIVGGASALENLENPSTRAIALGTRQRTGLLDSVQVWWTRTGRACCTHRRCLYAYTRAQSPSGGDTLPSRGDSFVPTRVRAVVICGLGRKWRALSTRE